MLVGIGVAAFMQAGVSYVLAEGRIFEVAQAYVWLVGLAQRPRLGARLAAGGRRSRCSAPVLLALGAPARRAGARRRRRARPRRCGVERSRLALLAAAVVLTGVAVAAAGPIGFVAFIAPHIARRLAPRRRRRRGCSPLAAGCGAVLVLVADLAGRLLFAPTEIPVGIVTSIIAAPYFLFLLRRATAWERPDDRAARRRAG